MADLQAQGAPIEGEAGVGHRLAPSCDLPPVMFDREEVLALLVGGRLLQAAIALAAASRRAEARIRAILDDDAPSPAPTPFPAARPSSPPTPRCASVTRSSARRATPAAS